MRHAQRSATWFVVVGAWMLPVFAGGAPSAIETNPDFKFAVGLRDFQYCDYAEEVFNRLKADERFNDAERARIFKESSVNYTLWSSLELYAKDQLARLKPAVQDLTEYGKLAPSEDKAKREHLEHHAELLVYVGRRLSQIVRFPRGDLDLNDAVKVGDEIFKQAIESLDSARKAYESDIQEVESKARRTNINDEDRARRNLALEAKMEVENQTGWALYEWAQIYEKKDNQVLLQKAKQAEDIFTDIRSRYRGYFVVLPGTLGQGVCRMARGDYNGAVQSFVYVLNVQERTEDVVAVQNQALFFKGRAEFRWKRYADAETTLTELIRRRRPDEPLRSQARLELAKSQTERVRLLWQRAQNFRKTEDRFKQELEDLRSGKKKPPVPKDSKLPESALLRRAVAETRAKISENGFHAAELEEEYEPIAKEAFEEVQSISRRGGWLSMEASPYLPLLREVLGTEARGSLDRFAEAQQLEQQQKFQEAIRLYRETIRSAGTTPQEREIRANCWAQLGMCHQQLKEYYQSGLTLARLAALYPQDERANNAAFWSTILLGYAFNEAPKSRYVLKAYLDSQEHFVEKYPGDPRGGQMAFRLADMRRGAGNYQEAIAYYERVAQASPFYERARYHVGDAHWRVYLDRTRNLRPDQQDQVPAEAKIRLQKAIETLNALIEWADEQPVPASQPEIVERRRVWTGEARVRLAEIYNYEMVGQPEKALAVLNDMPQYEKHLLNDKDRAPAVWIAYLIRVRAHTTLGQMELAEKTANELIRRQPKFPQTHEVCRNIGVRYTELAAETERQNPGETAEQAAAREAQNAQFVQRAAHWFMRVLDVQPDQDILVYDETAQLLYNSKSYESCIDVGKRLVERFEKTAESEAEKRILLDTRVLIARSHARLEQWDVAIGMLEEMHKARPRDIHIRTDLAQAYQATARYDKAAEHWNAVAESIRQGRPEWFRARAALARCLALDRKYGPAYNSAITVVLTWHTTGVGVYRENFQEPVEEMFRKELGPRSESYWQQYQDTLARLQATQTTSELDNF